MKIIFSGVQEPLQIKTEEVNSLIVENQELLYEIVTDLKQQLEKRDGKAVLSLNDKPVEIAKRVDLVTDIYGLDVNSKTIITKVFDALSEKAVDVSHYESTQKIISELENYIDDLIWDMDCNLIVSEIFPKQILKAVNLKIEDTEERLPERLLQYIGLIRQYIGDKLFVFVNFRGFMSVEQFELLSTTLINHEYRVLFIDNKDYPRCKNENRLTIDIDLCEF